MEYLSWIYALINDFKYNYVVDTCVDYQQIQKCSTLRLPKGGFKDDEPWKGVDLHFRCLYKVLNAILSLQKYVIVLIALTFEKSESFCGKNGTFLWCGADFFRLLEEFILITIIMNLIRQTEPPNLKLQNSPAVSPIPNAKSPTFEVLWHSSYMKRKKK